MPYSLLLDQHSVPLAVVAVVPGFGVVNAAMFGPQAAFYAELFSPGVRNSGFSFSREPAAVLAGGPAPFVASLLLVAGSGSPRLITDMAALAVLTIVALCSSPETYRAHRRLTRAAPDVPAGRTCPGAGWLVSAARAGVRGAGAWRVRRRWVRGHVGQAPGRSCAGGCGAAHGRRSLPFPGRCPTMGRR